MNAAYTFTSFSDIKDDMTLLSDWQDKYAYIIDMGKLLPPLDEERKDEDHLVPGCVSRVWLYFNDSGDTLDFDVYSDALIVNGLLYIVCSMYYGKRFAEAAALDPEQIFRDLGLEEHLTPNRVNGLRAVLAKISGRLAAP